MPTNKIEIRRQKIKELLTEIPTRGLTSSILETIALGCAPPITSFKIPELRNILEDEVQIFIKNIVRRIDLELLVQEINKDIK